MSDFKDCEYRYSEDDILYCDNKYDKTTDVTTVNRISI